MLLFCGITLAFGQQIFTVKGKILDADNGKPVPTASVNLGAYHEESDAMGNFNLKVPAGSYILLVKSATFNDFQEQIRVDQSLSLTIKLGHDAQQIEGVTFTVKHQQPSTMVVKTLDEDYIHKNAAQNLGNLLTHISGVSALKTGNNIAKPIIHGMYGSRIAILNNGVKMEEQEWGVEHAPNIDPMNYQHIDVVKGASTLKFGSDAISTLR